MLQTTDSGAGMKSYLFGLRSAGQVILALLLASPASAQIVNFQRLIGSVDARTIASNGGGTPATLTLTPTASYVTLTCNDSDGCTITMGESGIPNGMSVLIVNVSSNATTFSDSAGVSELTGTIALAQWQTLALEYVTDRWVQAGTGGGAGTVTTTGSPASGNLAKFSGASSVTNADLTGAVTTSGGVATTLATDIVGNTNLRNSGALSVIGRSVNSSGDPADISASAASDAVLRESGSTVGFGTIATAGIANDAVTFAKVQNASGASLLVGRGSASGAGDFQEIALGAGLTMAGTTISSTVVGTGGGDVVGPASATNNGFAVFDGTTGKLIKDHAATVAIGSEVSGLGTGIATALGVNTGSAGAPVLFNGAGGTPSSLTLTNATGLPVAGGGTGVATLTGLVKGNGTSAFTAAVAGTDYNAPTTSGTVRQVVNTQTGAVATGTTTVPYDNTIPQNTEGTEFMTLAITPTSATNKCKIGVSGNFLSVTADRTVIVALFQDTTANALAAVAHQIDSGNKQITFTHYMTCGTTSSTTFKVRAGLHAAGTVVFNGTAASGSLLGGVMASSITITEIVP
jgi:hypothetical protein